MPVNRIGGTAYLRINGVQRKMVGNWTYNIGNSKREAVIGPDGVHGYKEMPQAPFAEGEITDQSDLDLADFQGLEDVTLTLELANGKTVVINNAWYASDGNASTEEGKIPVRFEGLSGEEV